MPPDERGAGADPLKITVIGTPPGPTLGKKLRMFVDPFAASVAALARLAPPSAEAFTALAKVRAAEVALVVQTPESEA